jgi:hypothetical protein
MKQMHHYEELVEMIETDIALAIFGVPERKISHLWWNTT